MSVLKKILLAAVATSMASAPVFAASQTVRPGTAATVQKAGARVGAATAGRNAGSPDDTILVVGGVVLFGIGLCLLTFCDDDDDDEVSP